MSKVWFAGGYYVDLDEYGQLRIAGPGNHLFCGLHCDKPFIISKVAQNKNKLRVTINFTGHEITIHEPVMGDIRSVRAVTEVAQKARPTFNEMQHLYPGQFTPTETVIRNGKNSPKLVFTRKFSHYRYGFELNFPEKAVIIKEQSNYRISNKTNIKLKIECFYDFPDEKLHLRQVMSNGIVKSSYELLPTELQTLLERTEEEIEHLLSYSKTSGYEYGTIFPRDWMESAELGVGDLSTKTIQEMYIQTMKNISPEGEGWHENVIGELAHQYKNQGRETIDRRMIDIEPRYILGLDHFSFKSGQNNHVLETFQRIARYVMNQAQQNELITFKEVLFGNWRDSYKSVAGASGKIAPYDVNVVFYPAALGKIQKYARILHVDPSEIADLVNKWKDKGDLYKFTDEHGVRQYAICLYGDTYTQLQKGHTDEAYNLIYGNPSIDDCISFAARLLDPNYFYTNSGPNVVAHNIGFSTTDYHGEVIWPKQTALIIGGLKRQLERSINENWNSKDISLIKDALVITTKKSLRAFVELDGVPELYIDKDGYAARYDTQLIRDGISSYIQLWSAVGFRKIVRDYLYVILRYNLPFEFFE